MLSLAKLSFVAAAVVACCASGASAVSNCTSTEVETVAKLDAVLADAPECARLNSLVAGEVTLLQVCADAECIKIVKKAAASAPDCVVDGEPAKRISLVAFSSCAVADGSTSNSTTVAPTPEPTPEPTTKASSSAGEVAGEAPSVVSTPTTTAPKSAAAHVGVASTVAVSSAAVLLFAAWM